MAGADIKRIYDAMKSLCIETSQMLSEIKGELAKNHFQQKNPTTSWYRSGAIDQPSFWLPYFLQVLFSQRDGEWGDRAVGVVVLFDDGYAGLVKYPIVVCGVLRGLSEQKPIGSDNFVNFCSKPAIWKEAEYHTPFFTARFPKSSDCSELTAYFLELVSLEDRAKLISLVVQPCLDLFQDNLDAARSAVEGAAVTPKDFLADPSIYKSG